MHVDETIPNSRLAVGDRVVYVGEQQRDGLGTITGIEQVVSYRYAVEWESGDERDVYDEHQLIGPLKV